MTKCDICKNEFKPTGGGQKRCSDDCRKEYKRQYNYAKANKPKPCAICSTLFQSNRSRSLTCSKECSEALNEKNKRKRNQKYRGFTYDTSGPDIRMRNMFLLRAA